MRVLRLAPLPEGGIFEPDTVVLSLTAHRIEGAMTDLPNPSGMDIVWLGQAGFALRGTSNIVIDPYLSDLCLDVHGLRREMNAPATPAELDARFVLVSHWHEDHLDLDSAQKFVDSGSVFVVPPSCAARLAGRGIPVRSILEISSGETITFDGVTVTAAPAVHSVPGFLTEDAVGFVVEMDGLRIYHSGDTGYDRSLLAAADRGPIDVALICTNGSGGNMDAPEAALLSARLGARITVPMHFGMWNEQGYGPGATLDPAEFAAIYSRLSLGARTWIPQIDEPLAVTAV
jgi:L-ascorbate 6-phosphate lactonase